VDLGITGQDQVAESQAGVEELMELGFGKCKLQVQVPEKGPIQEPRELIGKNIVTSFTLLASEYFAKLEEEGGARSGGDGEERGRKEGRGGGGQEVGELNLNVLEKATPRAVSRTGKVDGIVTRIKYVGGSVEAACALGVADGIVDLVGTYPPPPPPLDPRFN